MFNLQFSTRNLHLFILSKFLFYIMLSSKASLLRLDQTENICRQRNTLLIFLSDETIFFLNSGNSH